MSWISELCTWSLVVESHHLTATVPQVDRVIVGRIDATALGVNTAELKPVVCAMQSRTSRCSRQTKWIIEVLYHAVQKTREKQK